MGKETILVKLNSRLKSLEKNTTSLSLLVKKLNLTSSVQTSDMERILEAVIRAKESFKDSTREQSATRSRVRTLSEKVEKLEEYISESSNTMKMIVLAMILLGVLLLYLICSMEPRSRVELAETRETGTMTETGEKIPSSKDASPRSPERRSTWCGGSGANIPPILQPGRIKDPTPVFKRIREIQGDEFTSEPRFSRSTLNHALSTENQTIDEILAILEPRSLQPIPVDGWSPPRSFSSDPQSIRLKSIPEHHVVNSPISVQDNRRDISNLQDQDSDPESPLRELLQGGAGSPKPLCTPTRRVTWCGGGTAPASAQKIPQPRVLWSQET